MIYVHVRKFRMEYAYVPSRGPDEPRISTYGASGPHATPNFPTVEACLEDARNKYGDAEELQVVEHG